MALKKDLEEKVRGLIMEGVDIIFISDEYVFHRMKQVRVPMKKPVQIVFTPNINDLKALKEEDMKKIGWQRIPSIPTETNSQT